MPHYDPKDALSLRVREVVTARREALTPGMTCLHLAASAMATPDDFELLALANDIIDPIPFQVMPPRALRRTSCWVGRELVLPEVTL
ncbi:hypothetical protein [Deinococcus kurensis]|uniref:hypothetical protein n=1 Tax=Deinococcus kurensis TaxID=2662757 RepID=UPI0012D365BE|nr:hypothetical protein [Deinococcus kurensis]